MFFCALILVAAVLENLLQSLNTDWLLFVSRHLYNYPLPIMAEETVTVSVYTIR